MNAGKLIRQTGDAYTGDFENGLFSGVGTFRKAKNGNSYTGEWRGGKQEGCGKSTSNLETYEGQFHKNKRHRHGRVIDRRSGAVVHEDLFEKGRFVRSSTGGTQVITRTRTAALQDGALEPKESATCSICMTDAAVFAVVPCVHFGFCDTYASRLRGLSSACPICGHSVQSFLKLVPV